MGSFFRDLRYGLRILVKKPGFALIAILTLALGIGANTAIFSVVQAVLLRPLPFREQERLVVAWKSETTTKQSFVELSIPESNEWRSQSRVFEHLAAMTTSIYGFEYTLTGQSEPVKIQSSRVSAEFFPALGVKPRLGRAFTADEDRPGAAGVAVISHRLWQDRFKADPNLIGRTIRLNDGGTQSSLDAAANPNPAGQAITFGDVGFTVVGVMPPEFDYPRGIDLWVPLSATSGKAVVESRIGFLQVLGRLKPSVTVEEAQAELDTIIKRFAAQHPELKGSDERAIVKPLAAHIFGDARPALFLLLSATALLLLIACANIANLLLANVTSRRKELAVRAALGASRGLLLRQLVSESLVLAFAGGGLGVLSAFWLIGLFAGFIPSDIPRIEAIEIDLPVLLFTFALTLLAAFVCGLAPALIASKVNLSDALNASSGRIGGELRGNRLRAGLAAGQIAVTLMLLIGAGLASRSFLNLQRVALGFDPRNVLSFQVQLHGDKYPNVEKTRDFFQQLIERLEAQPGVIAAGATLIRPLEDSVGMNARYLLEGQQPDEVMRNTVLNCEYITPHYLRSIGIPRIAGREFSEQDNERAPAVVIISETMARTIFAPGVDPLGKRIYIGGQGWCSIAGIAGDARLRDLREPRWNVYLPYRQSSISLAYLTIRTSSDPTPFLAMARREVAALDPEQGAMNVMTMEQRVSASLARPRFNALLLNLLSVLAAVLAVIGIYGVVSYSVVQRMHEIGIRIALGARAIQVLKLVLMQGMIIVVAGVGAGWLGALALTRLMSGLLYGVSATDTATFGGIALVLAIVAFAACYLPARRATKVDPMIALRIE
jgi:putative ABC transport system permease protein